MHSLLIITHGITISLITTMEVGTIMEGIIEMGTTITEAIDIAMDTIITEGIVTTMEIVTEPETDTTDTIIVEAITITLPAIEVEDITVDISQKNETQRNKIV